jgi:hypothetical protein
MMEGEVRKLVARCWASCSKKSLETRRSRSPLDTWGRSGDASGYPPIVDGHSRMSRGCDALHVIAFVSALNSPSTG